MLSIVLSRLLGPLPRMIAELATTLAALCLMGVASGSRIEYLIAAALLWYTVGDVAYNRTALAKTDMEGAMLFARIYQWPAILGVGCMIVASLSGSTGIASAGILAACVLIIFQFVFLMTMICWVQTGSDAGA
jgi:hypothetical protein